MEKVYWSNLSPKPSCLDLIIGLDSTSEFIYLCGK